MLPLTRGANALTTSRTADGKTLTPRTISMSSVRPMQRTRGPVRPHGQGVVRTWTWSRVRKRRSGAAWCRRCVRTSSPVAPSASAIGGARLGIDQLGVDEAARAEVHAVLLLALAPERRADVADAHRLGHARAPALLEPRAGTRARRRPARRRRARARRSTPRRSRSALGRPLDQVGGVGRRQRDRSRARAARSRASAARCSPCRPGCGRARSARTPRAPRPATNGPAL